MSRRWVPPAHSPVSPFSLVRGAAGAAGVFAASESSIAAALERRFGPADITLTDSGTSALTLALRTVAPPGEAIAFPGYSCVDLITAAQGAGVKVRLYDVDPVTLSPDLESLANTIARGVSAVLVAPLYGYPFDVEGVNAVAAQHGIPVVEDAAQGAGATFRDCRIGSFGALTVLSFARGKGTTGGSGGALLVRDSRWFDRARELASTLLPGGAGTPDVIKLSAQWALGRPSLYWMPSSIPALKLGEMIYHPPRAPERMSRAARSILVGALALDDEEIAVRRAHARDMSRLGGENRELAPVQAVASGMPGYLRFAVRDLNGGARPAPRAGVLRGYPITLDQHEMSRTVLSDGERAGPGAVELRDRLFTVPVHSRMAPRDVERITSWLRSPRD